MNIKTALLIVTLVVAHGVFFNAHANQTTTTKETRCGGCGNSSCNGCKR